MIWLHGDDLGARRALRIALAERPWDGTSPSVEILDGPVHYLAGEASAIAQAAAGGPALPTVRRRIEPGRPRTLVHNVETLARIALLARDVEETGTRLVTVLGNGRAVVEIAASTTFTELLADLGWTEAPQAVLLGGLRWPLGAVVPGGAPAAGRGGAAPGGPEPGCWRRGAAGRLGVRHPPDRAPGATTSPR